MATTRPADPLYVVEHLEPDDAPSAPYPPWVLLEYKKIGKTVNHAIFSNLSAASTWILEAAVSANCISTTEPAAELLKGKKICLLDPKAEKELAPEDASKFDAYLFGGILGDDPPRDRTAELRQLGYPSRHLREVQMTTDTAVHVTKLVIEDKQRLAEIKYVDRPTITFNKHESVDMPFRYVADANGKPTMPEGMLELLHEDLNKAFEF